MKEVDTRPPSSTPMGELLGLPSGGALGRDPFAELAEDDPFVARLEELGLDGGIAPRRRS